MVEGNTEICCSGMTKNQLKISTTAGENFEICSYQMLNLAQHSATFKNPNFQNLCELGKILKYSLRPSLKNPSFESIDELGKAMS